MEMSSKKEKEISLIKKLPNNLTLYHIMRLNNLNLIFPCIISQFFPESNKNCHSNNMRDELPRMSLQFHNRTVQEKKSEPS